MNEIQLGSIRAKGFMLLKVMPRYEVTRILYHDLEQHITREAGAMVLLFMFYCSDITMIEFESFVRKHGYEVLDFNTESRDYFGKMLSHMNDDQFMDNLLALAAPSLTKNTLPAITHQFNHTIQ